MNFGEKLKQLRQSRNWSQPELAEAIGIEQSYLSKLENDKSIPSADMLNRILQAFDIELGALLMDIDDAEVRSQLSSIPQIAAHIQMQSSAESRNRNRWMIGSALCFALGFSGLIAGADSLLFPEIGYSYQSNEIVPKGKSGEVFESLEIYIDYKFAPVASDMIAEHSSEDEIKTANYLLSLEHANLHTSEYFLSYENRGFAYTTDLNRASDLEILAASGISNGGTRTFHLQGNGSRIERTVNGVMVYSGLFLLILGLLGFLTRIFRFFADYMLLRRKA